MTPLHSPLRPWAAGLMIVVAAVHAPLIPEHLEEAPYAGVLFVLLTLVALVLAGLLLRHDSRPVWAVTGLVTLAALVAFLVSRTTGLPQLDDDIGSWGGTLGPLALVVEFLALAASSYTLRQPAPTTPREQS